MCEITLIFTKANINHDRHGVKLYLTKYKLKLIDNKALRLRNIFIYVYKYIRKKFVYGRTRKVTTVSKKLRICAKVAFLKIAIIKNKFIG